jgi:polyferredoxin
MQRRKTNKLDNVGIGFFIGFLLPVIVCLWQLNVLIKLGSLCVFLNSAVFMGFIKLKFEKTARGILGATIIYAFLVLISRAF